MSEIRWGPRIGPFQMSGLFNDEHLAIVRSIVRQDWPWHPLLNATSGYARIQVNDSRTGRAWRGGTVVLGADTHSDWSYLVAHEIGHLIDIFTLDEPSRVEVRRVFGVEDDSLWHLCCDYTHPDAAGEAYADWVAHMFGMNPYRMSLGRHSWRSKADQRAIWDITMERAANIRVYDDVNPNSAHVDSIHRAAGRGLIRGDEESGLFDPDSPVTRAEVAYSVAQKGQLHEQ